MKHDLTQLHPPIGARGAVAVTGMSCRFPGAASIPGYWDALLKNTDAITEVPGDRFDVEAFYHPEPGTPGRTVSRFGGFLDGIRRFDAQFFGISPREAQAMDPQQRLLLETAWEAIEDAGLRPSQLAGSRTGVFVGQATADYAQHARGSGEHDIRSAAGGELRAVTAGRLSYVLDLRGPSMVIDTACSSSLVAVHSAKQSLLSGECDLAVVAGVNIILSPDDAIAYSQGGMLAPDGRCKFGDTGADGFVRSEGIGVIVLKRLADTRDDEPVRAVLLGSATCNDGKGSGLLLKPAVQGQAQMLREAYADAGVDPSTVDYVEAHGTGTRVGDGVELAALREVLGEGRPADRPCLVGSVKSNIGHTEAAAGLAGLIKAVLTLEHGVVPASLHITAPAADGPLRLVTGNVPVPETGRPAVLGVSSFGISGTNAHVVLTSGRPVSRPAAADSGAPRVLALSARSATALSGTARAYREHLTGGSGKDVSLRDLCYTAAVHRDHYEHRLTVTGSSPAELAEGLGSFLDGDADHRVSTGHSGLTPTVVFLFPGQGSQWVGMGRELYDASPGFRSALDECDAAVRAETGWSVLEVLRDDDPAALDLVEVAQPVLWALEVALAAHWRGLGITPDVVVGHSMGEVAAAQVAGALSIRDAAAVICRRSILMHKASGNGSMLWVELPADEAGELLVGRGGDVCVAADNSPTTSVLSGDTAVLRTIAEELGLRGVACRTVKVDAASHSPQMAGAAVQLGDQLGDLAPRPAVVPFHSTVRAAPLTDAPGADYWAENLRQPVRLTETLRALLAANACVVVEISPHPVLLAAVREVQAEAGRPNAAVGSLVRDKPELATLAAAVGGFHAAGGTVDWSLQYKEASRVTLPRHFWDADEYWHETRSAAETVREVTAADLGLGDSLRGLSVHGVTPVPCAAFFDAVLQVARRTRPAGAFTLHDVRFHELASAGVDASPTLRVALAAGDGFTVHVGDTRCATGSVRPAEHPGRAAAGQVDLALTECTDYVSSQDFHRAAADSGYRFDGPFRALRQAWRGRNIAVARFVPDGTPPESVVWETALQTMLIALPGAIPVRFGQVRVTGRADGEFWAVARVHANRQTVDVRLYDEHSCFAEFSGVEVRKPALPAGAARVVRWFGEVTARFTPPAKQPVRREEPVTAPVLVAEAIPLGDHETVLGHAASVLGTTIERLDARRALRDLGLDSLMAAQLSARLTKALQLTVPAVRLLGPESLDLLAHSLRL